MLEAEHFSAKSFALQYLMWQEPHVASVVDMAMAKP